MENIIENFKEFDDVIVEAQTTLDKIKANEAKINRSVKQEEDIPTEEKTKKLMNKVSLLVLLFFSFLGLKAQEKKKETLKDTVKTEGCKCNYNLQSQNCRRK